MDEHSDIMKFDDELKTIMKLYQADPVSESCIDKEIEQLRLSIDKKREQKNYDFSVVNTFNIYDDPTTTDLVRLAQENNELACAELYRKYYRVVYRLCMKFIRYKKINIHDKVLDILTKVFRAIPNLKNPEDFHLLLTHRTRNCMHTVYYKRSSYCECSFSGSMYGTDFEVPEFMNAFDKLNEKDKDMILLRADGFSYKEISQILNVSPKYVANRLHRIRKNLITSMYKEIYPEDYDVDE